MHFTNGGKQKKKKNKGKGRTTNETKIGTPTRRLS